MTHAGRHGRCWRLLLLLACCCCCWTPAQANRPPRFELQDGRGGGEVVVRLKEGAETPVGSVVYRLRASDPDGDSLVFAVHGAAANELLSVEPVGATEANLVLVKQLDREVHIIYSLTLFKFISL